ncbi:hypothetical protein [Haliea sp. E17]|uniref:hypothetical protein n=1 Tax=Haliea sp. E17 TaxID=3401576 RepID=UPI003AACF1D0
MFFNGQFQNGYVTGNLERAVEIMGARCAIEHFDFDDVAIPVRTPSGAGVAEFRVALAWTGHHHLELIQPGDGLVDLYRDYLPSGATLRFHHFGMRCADLAPVRLAAAEKHWPVALEGSVPGIDFLYLDARADLGHYLEYICASPEGWAGLRWPAGLEIS